MQCTPSIIHLHSLASIFNFGVHFIWDTIMHYVDSCVFFWDITVLQTCVPWRASKVHWYWLPNKVWTVTVELIDIIFAAIPSTFPYLHYNWYFISCCYWQNIGCWRLVTRWPGPAGVWRPLMSAWRTCHGDQHQHQPGTGRRRRVTAAALTRTRTRIQDGGVSAGGDEVS